MKNRRSQALPYVICFQSVTWTVRTLFFGYTIEDSATSGEGDLMTAEVDRSDDKETCRKLISLGYARTNSVRLYGQEVRLVSDPFPQEDGIAVEVVTTDESRSRTMKLPLTILQMASSRKIA